MTTGVSSLFLQRHREVRSVMNLRLFYHAVALPLAMRQSPGEGELELGLGVGVDCYSFLGRCLSVQFTCRPMPTSLTTTGSGPIIHHAWTV